MTYHTKKREALLALLREHPSDALPLESIVEAIAPGGVGRSTVYRLLSELVESGTLKKIPDARGHHFSYQYIGTSACVDHLHLKCTVCGRLIHLDHETTELLERRLKRTSGFILDDTTLLYGTCAVCNPGGK